MEKKYGVINLVIHCYNLHKNGIDENSRIINSVSPDPYLTVSKIMIEYFQKNITIVDLIDETNLEIISKKLKFLNSHFSVFLY